MRWFCFFAALMLMGCPQEIGGLDGDVSSVDGGDDGGAGGGAGGGVGGGAGGGVGGGVGGGAGGGGGGGGGTQLTWARLFPTSSNAYSALGGRTSPVHEIYLGDGHGRIHRFENGAWTTPYTTGDNSEIQGLVVLASGAVFAVGPSFYNCPSGACTQSTGWSKQTKNVGIYGLCGTSESALYAVGTSSAVGVLWKWSSTNAQWESLVADTGTFTNAACFVASNGDVFIAAQSKVARYSGGALTNETMSYPAAWTANDIANFFVNALASDGATLYAAGTKGQVIQRQSNGSWAFLSGTSGSSVFRALAAPSATEVYAGASGLSGQQLAKKSGAGFAWETNPPSDLNIWAMWAASPDEVWASGIIGSTATSAVYRGTR